MTEPEQSVIYEAAEAVSDALRPPDAEGDLVHLRNPRDRERLAEIAVRVLVKRGWRPADGQGTSDG